MPVQFDTTFDEEPAYIHEAARTIAIRNQYDPVGQWLDGLTWDGRQRMQRLFSDGFGCANDDFSAAVSRCFLIGAIARIRRPGCKVDALPVLTGPQGKGKSSGLRTLFGDWFGDPELGNLNGKDAVMGIMGFWCVEMAELDALRRSDVATTRAFVSRSTDKVRLPYERKTMSAPRRCVFAGTANDAAFLQDSTGNRRYWPLVAGEVDAAWLRANREQLFAEADQIVREWLDGPGRSVSVGHEVSAPWTLPKDAWGIAAERQADALVEDPWADVVRKLIEEGEWEDDEPLFEDDKVHSTDLMSRLMLSGSPGRRDALRLKDVMQSLGWEHKRGIRIGGRTAAGYVKNSH